MFSGNLKRKTTFSETGRGEKDNKHTMLLKAALVSFPLSFTILTNNFFQVVLVVSFSYSVALEVEDSGCKNFRGENVPCVVDVG